MRIAAALALGWSLAAAPQTAVKPNVVFILADDLGWGDLGVYGHPQLATPHLDRLARQGTLWTQFYVSNPVCSPSRTAFTTGQYPARHRIHGHLATPEQNRARGMPDWLDPSVTTLPGLLKQAGYRTAHFGKWHLGSRKDAPFPSAYGFDAHRTLNSSGPGWAEASDPFFRAHSTRLMVDEAIRFIEADRTRPFYVNIWTLVPHATLNPTEEQTRPFRRFAPAGVPDRGTKQVYYASVADLDAQIGRLLARLDELGIADKTLVVFSSDNGPEEIFIANATHSGIGSPGPFRGRKRSLYEGGVRVPFLARWPGRIPAGRVDDRSVLTAVDFLPTVAALAAVKPPAGLDLDGEDASDILTGGARERRKPILWEWRFNIAGHVLNRSPRLAIRDGDWKLLMNPERSRVELYDIPHDASELSNQADRRPEIVKRMADRLLAWHRTLPEGPIDAGAGRNDYPFPRSAAPSSEPEAAAVFESGREGYHSFRIPALLVTPRRTLLAFAEGRKTSRADDGDIDLVLRRSRDGGKTWGALELVYEEGGSRPVTIGNPCPVVDRDTGTIWLPFCRNNRDVLITHSTDDGKTWSKPVDITAAVKQPNWTWYATGPGTGIQLRRPPYEGRLVIPCDHREEIDGRAVTRSHVFWSDDHGRTWKLGGSAAAHTNESQAVELADGRLRLDMRNYWERDGGVAERGGMRAVAWSRDGGATWSDVSFAAELPEPVCQASFIRYSGGGRADRSRLLFSNPANRRRRIDLTLRLSYDEGETWPVAKAIHAGPSAYSSLAVLPDGSIGCLFEGGRESAHEQIRFARLTLEWLTDGRDSIRK